MDGLVVDSEPVWTVAEEELAIRLGGRWSNELKARIVGTRLEVAVPTILREYGADPTAEAVAQTSQWLLSRMVELFATKVRVLPGVIELMSALRREGFRRRSSRRRTRCSSTRCSRPGSARSR